MCLYITNNYIAYIAHWINTRTLSPLRQNTIINETIFAAISLSDFSLQRIFNEAFPLMRIGSRAAHLSDFFSSKRAIRGASVA